MKRRDFLKASSLLPFSLALPDKILSSWKNLYLSNGILLGDELPSEKKLRLEEENFPLTSSSSSSSASIEEPFPYDATAFEAAERIVFLNPREAVVNVIPKQGLSLDLRLVLGERDFYLARARSFSYQAVKDSLDIPITNLLWEQELRYRLEYRETGSKGSWKATPWRLVRTPLSFQQGGTLKVVLYSDDHTFDDADMGTRVVKDATLRQMRLSGDYINLFLQELIAKPDLVPEPPSEWTKTMSGFCLASALRQILFVERPDLVFIVGDTTGIGAGYKWKGLGLKDPAYGLSAAELDGYSRLFWLRMRKMLSALTPSIPVYVVLGNHDGESSYDGARVPACFYRKKYWRQPGPESGQAPDQNYFSLTWGGDWEGRGGVQFIVLDNESYNPPWMPLVPEQWTLGGAQKQWLQMALRQEAAWKFAFLHHVLGGWPRGTNEAITDYAYGRGPLFTASDYKPYCPNPEAVEQVRLTRWMLEAGVKALFYGHDHVFHGKHIGDEQNRRMLGVCVGSTKHVGELLWYQGELWQRHYGLYGRYWTEPEKSNPTKANFWGPSGYTRLTIDRSGARIEYVRAAWNHPNTNIPPERRIGEILSSILL